VELPVAPICFSDSGHDHYHDRSIDNNAVPQTRGTPTGDAPGSDSRNDGENDCSLDFHDDAEHFGAGSGDAVDVKDEVDRISIASDIR